MKLAHQFSLYTTDTALNSRRRKVSGINRNFMGSMLNKIPFKKFNDEDDNLITAHCNSDTVEFEWEKLGLTIAKPDYVVIQRAYQLGIVKFKDYCHVLLSHRPDGWRSDEINFLINNAGKLTVREMGLVLGRSKGSVAKQIFAFKLSYQQDPSWKEWELSILTNEIERNGPAYISKKTDRSLIDVKHQAIVQGFWQSGTALTVFPGRNKSFATWEGLRA